jgi:DNA-directed RNA polymerase specialized sigma24 family protein
VAAANVTAAGAGLQPVAGTVPPPVPGAPARGRTPEEAFDGLYEQAAEGLVRQVVLLTGDAGFARRAAVHAFRLAWQRWPEVARDDDPVGWVRAAAYDYALAPWRRRLPGWRRARPAPCGPLAAALLELPPPRRRAVLLCDGLGLGLAEVALEVEAGTAATAARIAGAREALAAAMAGAAGTGGEPEDRDDRDDREAGEDSGEDGEDGSGAAVAAALRALLDGGTDVVDGSGEVAARHGQGQDGQDGVGAPPASSTPPVPALPSAAGARKASERGVRRRTAASLGMCGVVVVAAVAVVLLGPGHGQGGAGQHGGVGPVPSGERSHAAGR